MKTGKLQQPESFVDPAQSWCVLGHNDKKDTQVIFPPFLKVWRTPSRPAFLSFFTIFQKNI